MKRILLSICLLINFSVFAQVKGYRVQIGTNYSLIGDTEQTLKLNAPPQPNSGYNSYYIYPGTIRNTYKGSFGLNVSGGLDYKISSRFFLSSGLSISYLRFQRTTVVEMQKFPMLELNSGTSTSGTPIGSIYGYDSYRPLQTTGGISVLPADKNVGKTSTVYLQIPVLAGTSFFNERLILRSGFTLSYLVSATRTVQQYSYTSGLATVKDRSTQGFNTLLTSVILQSTYMITKHVGFNLSAERSLSGIYDREGSAPKARYNVFSLGASYSFTK